MVWSRGSWHVNNYLLIFGRSAGPGEISKLQFRQAEFWVQIFNIPLVCRTMKIARIIAEMVGEVVEIPTEDRECGGKFLRVNLVIDIAQPLLKGLMLDLEEFETSIAALVKYERIPEFCYECGKIGHSLRECEVEEIRVMAMKEEGTEFGSWIKASPLVRVKDSYQRDIKEVRDPVLVRCNEDFNSEGAVWRKPNNVNMGNRNKKQEGTEGSGPGETYKHGDELDDRMEGIEVEVVVELAGELERNREELEVGSEIVSLCRDVMKGKGTSPSKPNS
ncbi:hypothetical protein Dsin_000267 [Dipteronia sinensis]|uniref:CCHC-type domain-containing protein n=1 Tax=Dipteronia sinensis TaxID=43782 RepID=A0AAE0B1M8_9ROSI|nr:hypothetical protein Dsin_000267 [Dipteronia sinensis]